jgi:hypothetical protein
MCWRTVEANVRAVDTTVVAVTRLDLDRFTLRPAERDARGTAYDAKHLVGVRVVVMI